MSDHINPNCDKRPPRGGWAPGNYMALCNTCRQGFIGDKRAVMCADCAYAPSPARGAAVTAEDVDRAAEAYLQVVDQFSKTQINHMSAQLLNARHKAAMRAALLAALTPPAGAVGGWIACDERCPKENRYVLAWCPTRDMAFQALIEHGVWRSLGGERIWEKITHWMETPRMTPLPAKEP